MPAIRLGESRARCALLWMGILWTVSLAQGNVDDNGATRLNCLSWVRLWELPHPNSRGSGLGDFLNFAWTMTRVLW